MILSLMGSRVPVQLAPADPAAYTIGFRFRITSSTQGLYFSSSITPYVTGVKVYRNSRYAGPYTCSLWATASATLLGTCSIASGSAVNGWFSASFSSPIPISFDTDYIVSEYSFHDSYTYTVTVWPYQSGSGNPLIGLNACYKASGSKTNPAPPFMPPNQADTSWHGMDVVLSGSEATYPTSGRPTQGTPGVAGYIQGINTGGPTSISGDSPFGRPYQVGVTQSMDGFPSAPCLTLQIPGFWRFRWVVKPGPRAIYVWANQNSTGSYRPSVVVKSSLDIGLANDISASAPDGVGWQQVGPITFTATGTGAVWVELRNNNTLAVSASLFDHIITT